MSLEVVDVTTRYATFVETKYCMLLLWASRERIVAQEHYIGTHGGSII